MCAKHGTGHDMNENTIAEMEAQIIDKGDAYFKARPRATAENRNIFVAGFKRGFESGQETPSSDKVKSLEWTEPFPNGKQAETPFGVYEIDIYPAGCRAVFRYGTHYTPLLNKTGTTLDDAKAVAESHWRENVKACLSI